MLRIFAPQILKEAVDGGQADVACCGLVAALALQVVQKCPDDLWTEIRHGESGQVAFGSCGKLQEQLQAVAVAEDRMRAASALLRQVIA
jgi:hypothetical protein